MRWTLARIVWSWKNRNQDRSVLLQLWGFYSSSRALKRRTFLLWCATVFQGAILALVMEELGAFEKLFASVSDPQTQENHARHLALAKNVLYQNEQG